MTVNAWNDDAPSTLPRRPRALSCVSTGLGTILFLVVVALLAFFLYRLERTSTKKQEFIENQLVRLISRVAVAMESFCNAVESRPCLMESKQELETIRESVKAMRTGNGDS